MLSRIVEKGTREWSDAECLSYQGSVLTYRRLYDLGLGFAASLAEAKPKRVGLHQAGTLQLVALLVALDLLGAEAFIFHRDRHADSIKKLAGELELDTCISDDPNASSEGFSCVPTPVTVSKPLPVATTGSKVVLFTSGTTGNPKGVAHTWQSLAGPIREDVSFRGSRWVLLYDISRFAGIQVLLQCLINGGRLTLVADRSPQAVAHVLQEERISHVSATPTFWRRFLLGTSAEQRAHMDLKQISLGGEAALQPLLSALRRSFPSARITHTYASTEGGFAFAASDGLEGYPLDAVYGNKRGISIQVVDGELWVASPHTMLGYIGEGKAADDWVRTGDIVEIRDGRLRFLGRKEEMINVGGQKAYPAEIEREIAAVPGVQDVRVYGKSSSLIGQLVKAEVVPAPGVSVTELRQRILKHCTQALPPYQVPRLLEFVDQLPMAASGKTSRGHG